MSRTYKLDAAKYRRLTDAAGMIGDEAAELAEYLGLSEREALWVHILVVCALAEMMSNRPLALEMLRINWPDLFEPEPEPVVACAPVPILTHALLELIQRHPDGDFSGEELRRIRAIGDEIYRHGDTVDLQIARSIVEDQAGEAMRKRLDRIWYSDLERIPFDDHNGHFKGLDR